jgi:hypothetical protein
MHGEKKNINFFFLKPPEIDELRKKERTTLQKL